MERVVMVAIVLIVAAIGFLASAGSGDLTGQTVSGECECIATQTVCAVKDKLASEYPSTCHAVCEGARVIYEGTCSSIPNLE